MRIIGHGVDIVEIARVARMLDDHGERFLARIYTPDERAYILAGGALKRERLAARFAAKEAAFKALGVGWSGGVAWTDAEVVRALSGEPSLRVAGELARLASVRGVRSWLLSISHAGDYALASAMALGDG